MTLEAHRIIRARREALGFSDYEVAQKSGLSIYEYGDLELRADEVISVAQIGDLRRVCKTLGINLFTLFGLQPQLSEGASADPSDDALPRNALLAKRRHDLNLSESELGDMIGFETSAISDMEAKEGFLETWSFELVGRLASALNIPIEVLLTKKDEVE